MTEEHQRYSKGAIILHWAIAAFIIVGFIVAPFMEGLVEPYRTLVVRLHQSSGMTVLLLTVIRIGWRLARKPPPLDAALKPIERRLANGAHFMLYLGMLALPLSGWALISANPARFIDVPVVSSADDATAPVTERKQWMIMLWGAVPLVPIRPLEAIADEPDGVERQRVIHDEIVELHKVAGYCLLAVLLIHIAGALKHQFLDRRSSLRRMWFK